MTSCSVSCSTRCSRWASTRRRTTAPWSSTDSRHAFLLIGRAHPTPADLTALVRSGGGRGPVVVVADRISDAGRDVLRADGWGWLDRRGHLRLWAPGLRIESPLAGDGPRPG